MKRAASGFARANLPVVLALAFLCLSACSYLEPAKKRIQVDLQGTIIEIGSVKARFDKVFGGDLREEEIRVLYYPDDDAVCLRFKVNLAAYYQFWSEANRAAFIDALNRFKADSERGSLETRYMRAKRIYGAVLGYVVWESHRFSLPGFSYPNVELGYYFKGQRPYFAVTQREAPDESESSSSASPHGPLVLYFTRGQADALAALFAPERLRNAR